MPLYNDTIALSGYLRPLYEERKMVTTRRTTRRTRSPVNYATIDSLTAVHAEILRVLGESAQQGKYRVDPYGWKIVMYVLDVNTAWDKIAPILDARLPGVTIRVRLSHRLKLNAPPPPLYRVRKVKTTASQRAKLALKRAAQLKANLAKKAAEVAAIEKGKAKAKAKPRAAK